MHNVLSVGVSADDGEVRTDLADQDFLSGRFHHFQRFLNDVVCILVPYHGQHTSVRCVCVWMCVCVCVCVDGRLNVWER